MIARLHPVQQAIAGLHQAEATPTHRQGADHLQRVERELLEELAVALAVGSHAGRAGLAGTARQERRAQGLRRKKALVGLDLGQRVDAAAVPAWCG
jgi:hypothetical protein